MRYYNSLKLIALIAFLFVTVTAFPSVYYVSADGDNNHTKEEAQQIQTPWKSVQYAVDRLLPGDTLKILPGTYSEVVVVDVSGTRDDRIVICNYDDGEVIIDGLWDGIHHPVFPVSLDGGTLDALWSNLWTIKGDYITVKGIKWVNSPGRAISSGENKGLIITDFSIKTCYGGALVIHSSDSSLVQNGYVEDGSAQYRVQGAPPNSHVVAPVNSTNSIFRNLTINSCWGEAIAGYTSYNTLIENVTVINNAKVCFYMNVSAKCTVRNCIAYWTDEFHSEMPDITARAIIVADEYAGENRDHLGLTSDLVITNNLIINADRAIHIASGNKRASNLDRALIANNTFRAAEGGEALKFNNLVNTDENPRVWKDVYIENNIFDGIAFSNVSSVHFDKISFSNNAWTKPIPAWMKSESDYYGPVRYAGSSLLTIPEISSFQVSDYGPAQNSPVINRGKIISDSDRLAAVTEDYFGYTRDSYPDMGAIEFTGSSVPSAEAKFKNSDFIMDGTDSEWTDVTEHEINVDKSGSSPAEDDLSGTYRIAWDMDNLYFLLKIMDQEVTNSQTESVRDGDFFEIGFSSGYEEYDPDSETSDDALLLFSWGDSLICDGSRLKDAGNSVEYANEGFAGGYYVEMKIPFSELDPGLHPDDGSLIWIELALGDSDNGLTGKNELRWSGVGDMDTDMSDFGIIYFTGKQESGGSGPGTFIREELDRSVILYPNPAGNLLNVTNLNNVELINVYNLKGKYINTISSTGREAVFIDVSGLCPGLYLLGFVYADGTRKSRQFVKN